MRIFIFVIVWFLSGLVGSHMIISHDDVLTWGNSFAMGIITAVSGPLNLFTAIIMVLIIPN